jgi:uncharacterized protein
MKKYFKIFLVLTALTGVISMRGQAQENTVSKVHLIARAEEKAIVLRIAPGSPSLWEVGNKHGYIIERFTVTRGNQYLGNREREVLTPLPLKPLPMPQWEAMSLNNTFAEIAAEAIYGETFELSTGSDQDIMQLYNKAKELESRYSFALFCADVSAEVAQASGLYFKDTDVRKDERYLYRVYSTVPQTLIPSDTGFVYLSLEDYAPLPEIKDVKVQFSDRLSMISWNTRYVQSFYSAYWVERSEDGKNFKKTTELPYVNLYPENVADPGVAYKIDSLSQNNKTYHYRVIGISPFGETGPPSEIVKGEGAEALGVAPALRRIQTVNGQSLLQWEFPKEKESAITGFEIERSRNTDTGYKKISPLLQPTDRNFQDSKPEGTNYYRVKAIGKGGEKSFSFPTLHQLEDSIPPLQPSGLVGFIDTTGLVTLHWNNNVEEDLSGYRVFRSNFQNSEFSQVTSTPVDTVEFKERIPLQNLSREMYYKIQAIDTRFNPSGYSRVLKLIKPDVVPPVAPVIKEWKASGDKLSLSWTASASKDVSKHNLKMKRTNEPAWLVTQSYGAADKMQYEYAGLKAGSYEFVVEAIDSSGNAMPSKPLKANITGGARKSIENVKATADRANKKIVLSWKEIEPDAKKILIYRAEGTNNVTLYKSISGDRKLFEDEMVVINTAYSYYLKIIFTSGEESGFGEKVEVKF